MVRMEMTYAIILCFLFRYILSMKRAGNTPHSGKAHYSSFSFMTTYYGKNSQVFYNMLSLFFFIFISFLQVTRIRGRQMSGDLSRHYLSWRRWDMLKRVDGMCCCCLMFWRWWWRVQQGKATRWIFIMNN